MKGRVMPVRIDNVNRGANKIITALLNMLAIDQRSDKRAMKCFREAGLPEIVMAVIDSRIQVRRDIVFQIHALRGDDFNRKQAPRGTIEQ